jgi:peroxiredoxin
VARRWTFLIDPEGVVRKIYDVKDFSGHPDEVLADLNALAAQ